MKTCANCGVVEWNPGKKCANCGKEYKDYREKDPRTNWSRDLKDGNYIKVKIPQSDER